MEKGAPKAKAFRCCQREEGWWRVQDLVFCVVSSSRLSLLDFRLSPLASRLIGGEKNRFSPWSFA
ncbi:unnamed protein product [Musa textilis]